MWDESNSSNYWNEFQFMEKMSKAKNPDIYCFRRRVQRYLDDLLLVNGGNVMDKYAKDIYPSGLVLKKENNDDQIASFLCLCLTKNKKLRYSLYDKRDDFPFEIVSCPNLSGNIYSSNAYGVLIGQMLRISEACEEYDNFVKRSN